MTKLRVAFRHFAEAPKITGLGRKTILFIGPLSSVQMVSWFKKLKEKAFKQQWCSHKSILFLSLGERWGEKRERTGN
jgi:hypothetical protein